MAPGVAHSVLIFGGFRFLCGFIGFSEQRSNSKTFPGQDVSQWAGCRGSVNLKTCSLGFCRFMQYRGRANPLSQKSPGKALHFLPKVIHHLFPVNRIRRHIGLINVRRIFINVYILRDCIF